MQYPTTFVRLLTCLAAAFTFVVAPAARAQAAPPPAAAAPGTGAYTDEQAARGDTIFAQKCVACHTRKDYSNPDFQLKWQGRTAFDLFEKIRTTMPDDSPGSLARDTYADLVAYLLKLNGMPTGSAPLPPDSATLVKTTLVLVPPPAPPSSTIPLFTALFPRGR